MTLKSQRKIPPDLTGILLNRIYISRELKLFSLTDIGVNWELSNSSIFRYASPRARELSLLAAKRATEAHKNRDRSLCQLCALKLEGHDRCKTCTMLIHDVPECSCEKGCVGIEGMYKLIVHINNR